MKRKKSIIPKLLMISVVAGAGVVYFNPSLMKQISSGKISEITSEVAQKVKNKIVASVKAPVVSKGSETVYKWRDDKGKWHYSNDRPKNVRNVEKQKIDLDQNVVSSTKTTSLTSSGTSASQPSGVANPKGDSGASSGPAGSFSSYKDALAKTRAVKKQMEQRNRQMDKMAQ